MRKSVCIEWYERILKEMLMNEGGITWQHPCIDFGERVKAGEFDKLPDKDYFVLLGDVEEIASCWEAEHYRKTWEICRNAFKKIRPNDEIFHKLAEILAERYEEILGPFVQENIVLDSDERYNLQLGVLCK